MHTHDDQPVVLVPPYHALMYGSARRQLMHEYVQKSITTTLPRSSVRGQGRRVEPGRRAIESRQVALHRGCARCSDRGVARGVAGAAVAAESIPAISACSMLLVLGARQAGQDTGIPAERDRQHGEQHRHAEPAAQPFAGANERLSAAITRLPASRAMASEVTAPSA